MITLAYIWDCTAITEASVRAYVAAQQIQIDRDFGPAWNIQATCVFVPPMGTIPDGSWQIWLKDRCSAAGDLGIHTDDGVPAAVVGVLDDQDDGVSWSVTASHETLEMLADPFCNTTVIVGGTEYCHEVCDAPESDQFSYEIDGIGMSAFVLPSWFNPAGVAPFTFPAVPSIVAPFGLAEGGYIGQRTLPGGPWTQHMAEVAGPRQVKRPNSRTMRRFRK